MHLSLIIYHIIISKFLKYTKKFKSSPIIKTSTCKAYDIILDACVKYENYPIKTVGEDIFYSFYILLHYFKISKNRQKLKNSPIVKKRTSQVSDIILDACIKFQNYSS